MPPKKPVSPDPHQPPRPTDAELAILRVLWKREHSTVREIMEDLNAERGAPLAYTTVLKFMQIMTEKGLVGRDDAERAHSYHAAITPERTKKQLVGDLVERLFDGSVRELVLQALGHHHVTKDEAAEIRKLLNKMEVKP